MLQLFDQLDFRCGGKAPIKQMKVASLASIEHSPLYFIGAILYSDTEGEAYYISGGDAVSGWTFTKFGSGGSTVDTVLSDAANESISGNSANQKEVNIEVKSFTEHYKDSLVKSDVGLGAYPNLPADLPIQSAQATVNSNVQTSLTNKEDSLGNPLQDSYILTSLKDGTRSWKDDKLVGNLTNEVIDKTDSSTLTIDLNNKPSLKTYTITTSDSFNLDLVNMLVGDELVLDVLVAKNSAVNITLNNKVSKVNPLDTDPNEQNTIVLPGYTDVFAGSVNTTNYTLITYHLVIKKVRYPRNVGTANHIDFYTFVIANTKPLSLK